MKSEAGKRAWEAPVATMLSIRLTAQTGGRGADNYQQHDVFGGKELTPAVPTIDKASRRAVAHTSVVASDQQAWEAPAVTTLPIR
jgi:hypothetical protein